MAAVMSGALMAEKRARKTCWPAVRAIHFTVLSTTCDINKILEAFFSIGWTFPKLKDLL